MSARPVNPVNGKYTIPGKHNKNLELTLDDKDTNKYIVETLDGTDMDEKLPSSNPDNIDWFACFSIYINQNGQKHGYASVQYFFTYPLSENQRLFVSYNGRSHEVTQEMRNSGKVVLREGDPAAGSIPPG
jgi:hypothetical protein